MFPIPTRKLAVVLFIVGALAFIYGMGVGAFSLREPDTCFLLAMGRWICQHKVLPTIDPFSYTLAMFPEAHGLVLYQWLTEVIFYMVANMAGIAGLITFACAMLVYSLIIMPWRILDCFKLDTLRIGLIVVLVALGSMERMMLKPELFSYLFLALFLEIIVKEETNAPATRINWKVVGALAAIMLLWANLHSGFVIGVVLILVMSSKDLGVVLYCALFKHGKTRTCLSTWTVSFPACLIASLLTPYGILLWRYIPQLYFHPANKFIHELQPFFLSAAFHNLPLLCSFGGLLLLTLWRIMHGFHQKLSATDLVYVLIAIVGIGLGLLFQRLITFALLLMLPLIGSGFRIQSSTAPIAAISQKNIHALIMLSAIAGSLCMLFIATPTIPAISKAFVPPFEALKSIAVCSPQGNLFNDPEFGDVLIWNLQNPPKLFIDTRFDAYPWQIEQDYMVMRDCRTTWKELLAKYQITWVFSPPSTTLCKQLETVAQWRVTFKDKNAEIIMRQVNEEH